MDNQTRSEISKRKAIDAALSIVSREGARGLTFDALARESGISKGGLLHQFGNKAEVLRALLQHQQQQFDMQATRYIETEGRGRAEQALAGNIAMYRESLRQPNAVQRVMLAAILESPELIQDVIESNAARLKAFQENSEDPDLSLLRWFAAAGLAFSLSVGITALPDELRDRLFDRLLDDDSWKRVSPS